MDKLKISGVVVSHNEAHLLKACLASLSFCDQLVVIDLESNDDTQQVAQKLGAEVWEHKRVPVVEMVHADVIGQLRYDWVLLVDPDEVYGHALQAVINNEIDLLDQQIGVVSFAIRFYFEDRKLIGTPWGTQRWRRSLIHRERFDLTPQVHAGRKLKPGFRESFIGNDKTAYIEHYWMQDMPQLRTKHERYLQHEGQARFDEGMRTNSFNVLVEPIKQFIESYFYKRGFLDGNLGIRLSLFWSWYQKEALKRLLKTQKDRS